MSSSITLLAAGSLRPALTPLITHFTHISGIDVKVEYGPAGLLRERIEAGEPCALFASASREHPQRLLAQHKALSTHTFCWNQLGLVTTGPVNGWICCETQPCELVHLRPAVTLPGIIPGHFLTRWMRWRHPKMRWRWLSLCSATAVRNF